MEKPELPTSLRRVEVKCVCGRAVVFNTDLDTGVTSRCDCGLDRVLPSRAEEAARKDAK